MLQKTLLKASLKRHKSALLGVFAIVLIASISLSTALAVFTNSYSYVEREMERLGFGDLTSWVSGVPDIERLTDELLNRVDIANVGTQALIHGSYSMNEQDSDSEGQLIKYQPEDYPYRIFTDNILSHRVDNISIEKGEIYISPSMVSIFGAELGDEISFSIARSGGEKSFIVKGFFEDPFMGSSMIGMKSFLIGNEDFSEISEDIKASGIDALARVGAMLHIFKAQDNTDTIAQWNSSINEGTMLSQFTEFAHSKSAIAGFMLLLQNIFTGFLLVFVVAILVVSILILGHTISSSIERDTVDMGIFKGIGFTSQMLRRLQLIQYLIAILSGMFLGLVVAFPLVSKANSMTLTTTGIMPPSDLPIGLCIVFFAIILVIFIGFISLKTARIANIRPLSAIHGRGNTMNSVNANFPIRQKGMSFWLAVRQLTSGKKQYISALIIAVLLVFMASMVGRVNTWLGADGKGLMDAFNPADHDIGVQRFGELSLDEIESVILEYTDITDSYLLAMPGVTVNGVDYTANVINEPERFHILNGRSIIADNEVVLTEIAAKDLGVDVGGIVSVSGVDFTVSGIYQCANDMGANLGMNREGYRKIGEDTEDIWCTHYFISDPSKKAEIIQSLTEIYGGDVHLHENGWSGLYGIISAMKVLISVMYIIIAAVILIVIMLISSKLLAMEHRNLSIYKSLGFSNKMLRNAFAIRFTLVAAFGSGLGIMLSTVLTDRLVSGVMRLCGISNFSSRTSLQGALIPAFVITILFAIFGYIASAKISRARVSSLSEE